MRKRSAKWNEIVLTAIFDRKDERIGGVRGRCKFKISIIKKEKNSINQQNQKISRMQKNYWILLFYALI